MSAGQKKMKEEEGKTECEIIALNNSDILYILIYIYIPLMLAEFHFSHLLK